MANSVERALEFSGFSEGPYFVRDFGTADVIMAPYLERILASLFYYKGYDLRREHPKIGNWFDAMETRECYRGTMSDFNTHAKNLPRLMGGCFFKFGKYLESSRLVDQGPFTQITSEVNSASYPEPRLSREAAAFEVIMDHEKLG